MAGDQKSTVRHGKTEVSVSLPALIILAIVVVIFLAAIVFDRSFRDWVSCEVLGSKRCEATTSADLADKSPNNGSSLQNGETPSSSDALPFAASETDQAEPSATFEIYWRRGQTDSKGKIDE